MLWKMRHVVTKRHLPGKENLQHQALIYTPAKNKSGLPEKGARFYYP